MKRIDRITYHPPATDPPSAVRWGVDAKVAERRGEVVVVENATVGRIREAVKKAKPGSTVVAVPEHREDLGGRGVEKQKEPDLGKLGRPVSTGRGAGKRVLVLLSADEVAFAQARADEDGVTVQGWLRGLIAKECGK